MSQSRWEGGGSGHHPDTAAAISAQASTTNLDQGQDSRSERYLEPVGVWAPAYAPAPGRSLWAYPVNCPTGHGVHLHRGGPPRPEGHLRHAKCGQTYRIFARTVLPSAAVAS